MLEAPAGTGEALVHDSALADGGAYSMCAASNAAAAPTRSAVVGGVTPPKLNGSDEVAASS
jgi:hypothetical protein